MYEYFNNISDIKELKKEYRRLVMIHHPDVGGDENIIKVINNKYKDIYIKLKKTNQYLGKEKTCCYSNPDYESNNQDLNAKNYYWDNLKNKFTETNNDTWGKEVDNFQNEVYNSFRKGTILKDRLGFIIVTDIACYYSNFSDPYWRISYNNCTSNGDLENGAGFFRITKEDFYKITHDKKILDYEIFKSSECKHIKI